MSTSARTTQDVREQVDFQDHPIYHNINNNVEIAKLNIRFLIHMALRYTVWNQYKHVATSSVAGCIPLHLKDQPFLNVDTTTSEAKMTGKR